MDTKETKYVIDTEEAIQAIAALSTEYKANASALGTLYREYGSAVNEGEKLISSFTQITAEGKAVKTTIHSTEEGIKNYKTEVTQATAAQLKFIQRQQEMAQALELAKQRAADSGKLITLSQDNKQSLIERFGVGGQALRRAIKEANEFQISIQKANIALARLGGEGQPINAVAGLGKARVSAERLKADAQSILQFFERINNIGIATVIYRGLSGIGQGFKASLRDAAEFEREVALIQTLAQDSGETFDSWSKEIRKVSDQFGTPIVDVATAAYEGLSAQVIHTTKDFNVLSAALSLAKTTKSDTVQSLNVISAVINGFGLSTEEASRVADKLFTTIDIGNVKVDELATSIGRGAALAKQANSSYEELFAGIGVITQTGVSSAEAVTLLNNVFVQLSKPSEVLKQKLKELNFATGQQALGTLGLIGTLRELSKVAKDVPNGLAGLFPDIRGLRGAESLSGDASQKFIDTLDKITNSAGNTSRALKIVQENAGDKFLSELERFKTIFTVDIGKPFLESVVGAADQIGGLSSVLKSLTIGVLGSVAAVGAFKAAMTGLTLLTAAKDIRVVWQEIQYMRTEFTLAQAAAEVFGQKSFEGISRLKGLFVGIGVAAAAYTITDLVLKYIIEASKRAAEEEKRLAKEASDTKIQAQRDANVKILEDFDKTMRKQSQSFGAFVATQQELATAGVKATAKETERIAGALQNRFDLILGTLKNNVSDIESSQKKAIDAIKDIQDSYAKTQVERSEQYTARNIKLAELERDRFIAATGNKQQAYLDYARKISAINEQRIAFVKQRQTEAINRNDISEAERLNSEIRSILDGMQDLTIEAGNVTRPLFNQQQLQNRISQEADRFNQALKDRLPQLEAEVAANGRLAFQEKERTKTIEDMLKKTAKFSETVVKDGQFTPDFAKDPSKAIADLKKLQDEARAFVNQVGGLKNQQTLANLGINKAELDKLFSEQQKNLSDQINFASQQKALRDLTATQRDFVDKSRNGLEEVNKKITEQTQIYENNRLKILEVTRELRGLSVETSRQKDEFERILNSLDTNLKIGAPKSAQQNVSELERFLQANTVDTAKFSSPFDPSKTVGLKEYSEQIRSIVASMSSIESQGTGNIQAAFKSLSTVDPTNLQSAETALANIYRLTENATPVPGLDEAKGKLIEIIRLLEQVRRSSAATSFVGPPDLRGSAEKHASGGVVGSQGGFLSDFFSGRYKRGTDMVPTMLSKREVVVREPMAEKHAALLAAINGNRVPKNSGGSVYSQSVGNINITMPNGTTATQVRAFGRALNRALKQGTMNLGN